MPKRFTDSEKFRNPWYRKLSPKQKCVWEYLLSECSLAGIIELDYDAMSFHIGVKITKEDISALQGKLHSLPDSKILIAPFVKFQQGKLNRNNKAHKNAIKELEKYNIPLDIDIKEFLSPGEGACKGLPRSPSKGKGKGNGKGNGNAKEKISLEELSVSHIEEWLTQKRVSGKYLTVDEHELLEKFKDYCLSKGKTYKDYVAGFRNAFKWENTPKKGIDKNVQTRKERLNAAGQRGIAKAMALEGYSNRGIAQPELLNIQRVRKIT